MNVETGRTPDAGPALVEHLVRAVQGAEVGGRPFCHFYFRDVFPAATYGRLHRMLPAEELYHPSRHVDARRDDGTVTRATFNLEGSNLSRLDEQKSGFWHGIVAALKSGVVKDAIFGALWPDLAARFGISTDKVRSVEAFHHIALLRDSAGYRISPHPDTGSKIVTVQMYLPEDGGQADLGTSLYARRRGLRDLLRAAPPRFVEARRFQFLPNSGFAFAVSENSWHGREPLRADAGTRNSLALVYYDRPLPPGQGYD